MEWYWIALIIVIVFIFILIVRKINSRNSDSESFGIEKKTSAFSRFLDACCRRR